MNKFKILILVFLISNFYTDVFAQNLAYANMEQIINSSNVGKKIIEHFSKKNNKLKNDLKVIEQTIMEKENTLISQKNILQPEEYNKKVSLIRQEILDFNKNSQKKSRTLNAERDKLSKEFMIEINKVLRDYAVKNNIDIIFSSTQMLIGKSKLDVTENILEEVNKKITNFKIK